MMFIVYDSVFTSLLSSTSMEKLDIRGIKLDINCNDQGLSVGFFIYVIVEKSLYNAYYTYLTNLKIYPK